MFSAKTQIWDFKFFLMIAIGCNFCQNKKFLEKLKAVLRQQSFG